MAENKPLFGLYGAGGFAREVMPLAPHSVQASLATADFEKCFIETTPTADVVNNYPLMSEDNFLAHSSTAKYFNVAIGDSKIRGKIAEHLMQKNVSPLSIHAENVSIYDSNSIGVGSIICAFSTITSNAKIGKFFHCNIYSYVAHDCVLGDYVTFAPNVHCNGNVHIGNHAYIGAGAIIKQGTAKKPLVIGEGAVVGMGAVVTKNVPPFTTVFGNPAKPLRDIRAKENSQE